MQYMEYTKKMLIEIVIDMHRNYIQKNVLCYVPNASAPYVADSCNISSNFQTEYKI
jgi:hypothetical protein